MTKSIRKIPTARSNSRKRRNKAVEKETNEMIELEVGENDKNVDGTISKSANSIYAGKKWCNIKMKCVECYQLMEGPQSMKEHCLEKHSFCSFCGRFFKTWYNLNYHQVQHHNKQPREEITVESVC
jgi:hypothetical protein